MEILYLFSSLGMMLVTVTCIYNWFVKPELSKLAPSFALQLLLAIHSFRFVSPISLMPGVTVPGLSTEFTYPQVIGDCASAALALIAIAALRASSRYAAFWTWFASLFGLLDLGVVTVQGLRFGLPEHVGAMFYVVVWYVPWLLVTHVVVLMRLSRGAASVATSRASSRLHSAIA